MNIYVCPACKLQYKSNCALTAHQYQTPYCYHFITTLEDSSSQQVHDLTQSELTHSSDHTNSTNSTNDYLNDENMSIDNDNINEADENSEDDISIESKPLLTSMRLINQMTSYTKLNFSKF